MKVKVHIPRLKTFTSVSRIRNFATSVKYAYMSNKEKSPFTQSKKKDEILIESPKVLRVSEVAPGVRSCSGCWKLTR